MTRTSKIFMTGGEDLMFQNGGKTQFIFCGILFLISFGLGACSNDEGLPVAIDQPVVVGQQKTVTCEIPLAFSTFDCGSGGETVEVGKVCTVSQPLTKRGFKYQCGSEGQWINEVADTGFCSIPEGFASSDCGAAGTKISHQGVCIVSEPASKAGFSYTCSSGSWIENPAPQGVCEIPEGYSTTDCGGAGNKVADNGVCTVDLPMVHHDFLFRCKNGNWESESSPANTCTIPEGFVTNECGGPLSKVASTAVCTVTQPQVKKGFGYTCEGGSWRETQVPTSACQIPEGYATANCGPELTKVAHGARCMVSATPGDDLGKSYDCRQGDWVLVQ